MTPTTTDTASKHEGRSNRIRPAVALAVATAAAVPLTALVGFDQFVLARLATNHNEVGAQDA